MIFKLFAFSFLLVWGGCQTAPKISNPDFSKFQIQKITSAGVETVSIKPSSSAWPTVAGVSTTPFATDSKNLRIAVIGDTGCRLKESKYGNAYQDCSSTKEWPFSDVVKSLGNENYNFAIHTGDYHYREQCTDPKLCPTYGKYFGYIWGAWWDDFYGPAQPVFKKSPWIFVRGNHENCDRAYLGWAAISAQTKQFTEPCVAVEPYQWIEMDDIVFINFDNASMEDRKEFSAEEATMWKEKFSEVKNRIKNLKTKKEIWLLSHKPMFGFVPDEKDAEPKSIGQFMAPLVKESGLYDQVDVFLSGHIHTQQVVQLDKKIQLIAAQGGTTLDPFGRKILNSKVMTTTENKYSFGYALFEKTGFKKWNFIFKDTKGKTELECKSNANKVTCE